MSVLANPQFLRHLKSLFPSRTPELKPNVFDNPWYIVATVAFSACNKPNAVPLVYQHAIRDVSEEGDQLLLTRKLRDALFKSGLTSGYPRAINSLIALHDVTPLHLRDTQTMRNTKASVEEHEKTGAKLFNHIYGETSTSVQGLLDAIYPDMGWFSRTIGYGLTYGYTDVLTAQETSYTLVAALISGDTPRQITWHLDGARRGGASYDEVRAVRQISMEVAGASGATWKEGVPEVKEEMYSGQSI